MQRSDLHASESVRLFAMIVMELAGNTVNATALRKRKAKEGKKQVVLIRDKDFDRITEAVAKSET
jgi:hypothetical protein